MWILLVILTLASVLCFIFGTVTGLILTVCCMSLCPCPLQSMAHGDCGVNGQSVMHVRVCLSGSGSVTAPLLDLEVCPATASLSRVLVAMTTKPSAQVSFHSVVTTVKSKRMY